MRVMVLVKADKNSEAGVMPDEKLLSDMGKFNEELAKAGIMLAGEGLHPSSKGARVRFSGSKRTVIDGPFAESKELVAGYCIVQAHSKAEAIDWATRMLRIHIEGTGIDAGESDVREMFELSDFPVDPAEKPDGWRDQEQRFRDRTGQ
jgi:hypothetical protein